MKRPPTLRDWQDQYYKNGNHTKTNLQMQCNPHQNPNVIFHRNLKTNLNFIWKHKIQDSQNNQKQQ